MAVDDLRPAWEARGPSEPLARWTRPPRGIAWHYVGSPGRFDAPSHAACLQWVRATQQREMAGGAQWKYADFSYNLVGCPHGRVIEGRGLGFQSGAQLGGNAEWVSVVLLANVDDGMSAGLIAAAINARAAVLEAFPAATEQAGHRDVAGNPTGTACPGDRIEAWVHAGGATQPVPAPVEEDMTPDQLELVLVAFFKNLFEKQEEPWISLRQDFRYQVRAAMTEK